MSEDPQCKVSNRLDLNLSDLGNLQKLIAEKNLSTGNVAKYVTSWGEKLKFVRVDTGLWLNENYNITIRVPV